MKQKRCFIRLMRSKVKVMMQVWCKSQNIESFDTTRLGGG